jgi:hypothetical protein
MLYVPLPLVGSAACRCVPLRATISPLSLLSSGFKEILPKSRLFPYHMPRHAPSMTHFWCGMAMVLVVSGVCMCHSRFFDPCLCPPLCPSLLLCWTPSLSTVEFQTERLKNTVVHVILKMEDNYPLTPPKVTLCTPVPHPNIFPNKAKDGPGFYVCLDMLTQGVEAKAYSGWSSIYTIRAVMMQLQAFLCDDDMLYAEHNRVTLHEAKVQADAFLEAAACEARGCMHGEDAVPWPPLPYVPSLWCGVVVLLCCCVCPLIVATPLCHYFLSFLCFFFFFCRPDLGIFLPFTMSSSFLPSSLPSGSGRRCNWPHPANPKTSSC